MGDFNKRARSKIKTTKALRKRGLGLALGLPFPSRLCALRDRLKLFQRGME